MKHSKLLSIKSKFFSSMFLSSILMVAIITLISNTIFLNFFIKTQANFSAKELSYIQKQLEFFITSTDNYSRTIISDPLIQAFASDYKKNLNIPGLQVIHYIKGQINHIIQNTKYIHAVSLYDTNRALLVSTDNQVTPLESSLLDSLDSIKWIPTTKKSPVAPSISLYTFSCIRPFYSYSTGEPLGYIEISLLESEIRAAFDNHLSDTNNIFIVDQLGIIQSTNSGYSLRSMYPNYQGFDPNKSFHYTFGSRFATFYQFVPAFGSYIINQVPIHFLMGPIYTLMLVCFGISLLCILLYIPLAHKISRTITLPIMQVIHHTQRIKEGLWTPLEVSQTDTDILLLVDAFNSMVVAQEQLKNKLLTTQKAKDQLMLDLLQEQINPHFLYNTLDNISSLAEIGETDLLHQLIYNLANFYRKGLNNGKSYISIQEELDMIRSYIEIMQIRYYDKFDFTINCPPHLIACPCLKFLLQPIVENSIYHGIKPLAHRGLIQIHVVEEGEILTFIIQDNGIGISEAISSTLLKEKNDHFGLRNIHDRIQLHYGMAYGVHIQNGPHGGCEVMITLSKKGGN
ncbi:MAG: histidine kinase [Cellulosilyticaceae bacterium]